jgi:hypothetical protein
VALPVALLLLALAASPAAAADPLSNPTVSPNPATTADTVTFSITYTDANGVAPLKVQVDVDGTRHTMQAAPPPRDFAAGVVYTYSAPSTAGTHSVKFRWIDAANNPHNFDGTVPDLVITAAAVTPAPTPPPKPTAAPTPTPAPVATPTRAPTNPPAGSSAKATSKATVRPTARSTPKPTAKPVASGTSQPSSGPGGVVYGGTTLSPDESPPTGQTDGTGGGFTFDPGELARLLLPTAAVLTFGTLALGLFLFFKRRRRDDPARPAVMLPAVAGVETSSGPGPVDADEALIPRWRRPSLQEVRRADPLRAVAEQPHLSFEESAVLPVANRERRRIRYRLVRLLDSPDEFRSTEIGVLDEGDEVQLLERQGLYWLVLCPDGRRGWVHQMTISDDGSEAEAAGSPAPAHVQDQEGVAYPIEDAELADAMAALQGSDEEDLLSVYMAARGDVLNGSVLGNPLADEEARGPDEAAGGEASGAPTEAEGPAEYFVGDSGGTLPEFEATTEVFSGASNAEPAKPAAPNRPSRPGR